MPTCPRAPAPEWPRAHRGSTLLVWVTKTANGALPLPGCRASALLVLISFSFSSRFPRHRPSCAPGRAESWAPPRLRRACPAGMFQVGRSSVPKPAPRSLEDLDSVQRVLLHRSVPAVLRSGLGTGGATIRGSPWDEFSLGCSLVRGKAAGPAHTFQNPLLQVLRVWLWGGSPQRNHPPPKNTAS